MGNDYHFYSFLPNFEDSVQMLNNIARHLVEEGLIFKKEGEIVDRDRHKFLMLHGQLLEDTMKAAGLKLKEATSDDLYLVYPKVI